MFIRFPVDTSSGTRKKTTKYHNAKFESDVCRRQNLTSKDDLRAVSIQIHVQGNQTSAVNQIFSLRTAEHWAAGSGHPPRQGSIPVAAERISKVSTREAAGSFSGGLTPWKWSFNYVMQWWWFRDNSAVLSRKAVAAYSKLKQLLPFDCACHSCCNNLRGQTENLINPFSAGTDFKRQNLTSKGLAHAKIIKKSVILFWLNNMTIWCKHVHRLELQKFF